MYASWLVEALRQRLPDAAFFGCAGERLKAAGCEAVVEASRSEERRVGKECRL